MADDDDRKDDEQEERDDEESSDDSNDQSGDEGSEGDDSGDDDSSGDSDDDSDEDSEAASPSISAKEMIQAAMEALRDLTGYEPESATGLQWDGDAWLVTVDVCELRKIPNTTDLIATYVVQLDGDGNLSGYKRTRRFQRGASEEGQ
jgi:Gas vesicle synthesis protein GvpO